MGFLINRPRWQFHISSFNRSFIFSAHSNIQLESGTTQYDQTESQRPVLELPSATVRLDVLSVQGARKVTKSRKLEEGAKKVEGSDTLLLTWHHKFLIKFFYGNEILAFMV